MAVGASAIAELLNTDELIRVERENLTRLQEELQQKLRQAEIEVSLERARLSRERVAMEDRLRQHERPSQPNDCREHVFHSHRFE